MFKWFHKAGRKSDFAKPQDGVSELGVPEGSDDAVKWFRKAAEKGTGWGQLNLGLRYARGDGVPQDYTEAMKWFQKAADQGEAMSQYYLGEMYEKGLGVVVDQVAAYEWYCLAAGQGVREAENAREHLRQSLTPEQMADGQHRASAFAPKKSIPLPKIPPH